MKSRSVLVSVELFTDKSMQELKRTLREAWAGVTQVKTKVLRSAKKDTHRRTAKTSRNKRDDLGRRRDGEEFNVW